MVTLAAFGAVLMSILLPTGAMAQSIGQTVASVGGALMIFPTNSPLCPPVTPGSAWGFVGIACNVMVKLRPVLASAAVLFIIIGGIRMIVTQDDDGMAKAKTIISASIVGMILSFLIVPFINAFYGGLDAGGSTIPVGTVAQGNMLQGASVFTDEVLGIINWGFTFVAVIAVLMIIVSGFRALMKSGSEEGITELRRTVVSVIFGILLLVFHGVLNEVFGLQPGVDPSTVGVDAARGLPKIVGIVNFLLGFVSLIAVAVVIFAGIQMVLNFGKSENVEKAKGLLLRAILGLVIMLMSYALVNFIHKITFVL